MMRRYRNRGAGRALSIAELRHMARRRLPALVFEYLEGGAEDEVTLRRNRRAFETLAFLPSALCDVSRVSTEVRLFDRPAALPVVIAPTGFNGLLAPGGDIALARAAAAAGIPFGQSTVSNATLEDVAGVAGLRHWMQVYVFRSRPFMERLVARAAAAGCEALVLTVDGNVFGNREWDKRSYRVGTEPTLARKIEALLHPGWLLDVARPGIPTFGNLAEFLPEGRRDLAAAANWSREQVDPGLDWRDLDWLRAAWKGRLLVKGLLRPEDAARARDAGADGIVLSNHGGRQLDGTVAPVEMLAEVRRAVGPDLLLLVDSGIRRGSDVVKALALGADAVMVGRAALYGLAAGGEAGAARALALLAEETARVMALLGRTEVAALGPDVLFRGGRAETVHA